MGVSTAKPWRTFLADHFAAYTTAEFAPHHVEAWEWAASIERGTRPRPLIACWARGAAKSTTIELIGTWLGSQPQPVRNYVLYVSETQAQADRHVQAIASMLERVGISRAVNEYGASKGWRRTEVRAANGFNVTAMGLDSAMRGAKLDEFRPDLIVFDDIDGRHDSANTTAKKIDTITTSILPTGSTDAATIVVQNMIHEHGIMAQLMDGRADFLHDRLPAEPIPAIRNLETERTQSEDGTLRYRIVAGEPTWVGQDIPTCEKQINEWGERAFLREAQHEVWNTDDGIIKRHWFSVYERPDNHYLHIIQAWDTAFSISKSADYSACVTIGVGIHGLDVLDVYRARLEFPDLERALQDQHITWSARYQGAPVTVLIEDKASGQSLIQAARRWPHRNINIVPVSASRPNEKMQRVNEVSPAIEAGRVRLPVQAHWLEDALTEWTSFPHAAHDDMTDALAMAIARADGIGIPSNTATDSSAFAPAQTVQRRRFSR